MPHAELAVEPGAAGADLPQNTRSPTPNRPWSSVLSPARLPARFAYPAKKSRTTSPASIIVNQSTTAITGGTT